MTLFQAPILTDGAEHSAQEFRMLVRDLSRGSQGVTQGTDLKVTPLSTPGGGVQISDGSGIVRGVANSFQGSYSCCNIGTDTVTIAATGATARSDMVILRVLDPEYEGSLNPATDPIQYWYVASNVGSTATTVPAGITGIPLARIDLPSSTSTITAGMITDLRQIANARRDRSLETQSPTGTSQTFSGTTGSYTAFTTAPGWSIPIPTWASTVKINLVIYGIRYNTGSVFGGLQFKLGSSLTGQQVNLDDNQGTGVRRQTVGVADTLTIPDAYRGTNQTLVAQSCAKAGNAGTWYIDASTTIIADVEFVEAPR